jgi:DNA repair exonuclease SbcCD nuclease subunit
MTVLRVAGIADNQVDENSRLEEHDRVMQYAAEWGEENGVDLWIHAGDVYDDPDGSTEVERASVAAWVQNCAEYAPVVIVGGNHEAPGEVAELARLKTRFPVVATEDPGVHVVMIDRDFRPRVVMVQAMPWPRKSHLLRWMGPGADPERVKNEARESLRDILRNLGAEARRTATPDNGIPVILAAHVSLAGASSDSDQPMIGLDMELSLPDLALATPDFGVLGHIHKPQDWVYGGVPFAFCGSPRRTSYASGELIPKGSLRACCRSGRPRRGRSRSDGSRVRAGTSRTAPRSGSGTASTRTSGRPRRAPRRSWPQCSARAAPRR